MSIIDDHLGEVRASIKDVFGPIERAFPGSILAGGAVRDLKIGRYPKDLVFFVPFDGSVPEAALLLLKEGVGELVMGESDYHHTSQEIKTAFKQDLDWGDRGTELKVLTLYISCGPKVEIILSPVAPDALVQWYQDYQEIPLNTGYMRADGRAVIPSEMQDDLEKKVITLKGARQKGRADFLSRKIGWPIREMVH